MQAKSDADDGIQHVCGRRSWHEGRHWRQRTQKRLASAADAVQECERWSQQRDHGTLSITTASAWRMAHLLLFCSWYFAASTLICDWFLPRCCNSVDYSETAEHVIRVFCRPILSHSGIFKTNVSVKFWWSGCTESVWVLKHCKIAIFDEYVGLYLCL